MFTPEEIKAQLAGIEQVQNDKTTDDSDEEDPFWRARVKPWSASAGSI
jgi:hypothetical protein